MVDLILQLIFMISFGVIVYMIAISVPRIETIEGEAHGETRLSRWLKGLPLERVDTAFINLRDKLLRRLRILILKADNFVGRKLNNREDKL